MPHEINFKTRVNGNIETIIDKVTLALKEQGFGVLTRIDFHCKVKEKLGKDMDPVVILGACNPLLAFEAYQENSDVTAVLPCNVVLRQLGDEVSVEFAKPTAMMKILGDSKLVDYAKDADEKLKKVADQL